MAKGDPNNSPYTGPISWDGTPATPPGPYASEFEKRQYEGKVFNAQMVAQTRQDLKAMWAARSQDKMKDLQTARAIAEAAFDSMVATCINNGQVSRLMAIKNEWIDDMATGPIRSFSQYMTKWGDT